MVVVIGLCQNNEEIISSVTGDKEESLMFDNKH